MGDFIHDKEQSGPYRMAIPWLEQFSISRSRSRDLSNWFNCSILEESEHVLTKHALVAPGMPT